MTQEVASASDHMIYQLDVEQAALSMDDLSFAPTASGASFSPSTSISLPSSASSVPSFQHIQLQQQQQQKQQQNEELLPSRVFMDLAVGIINKEHLGEMFVAQRQMMTRFEKTNEMLQTFNELATQRYSALQGEYARHSQTLLSMKRDLDGIFKRIRVIKSVATRRFPAEMEAAVLKVRRIQLLKDNDGSSKKEAAPSTLVTSGSAHVINDRTNFDVTWQTPVATGNCQQSEEVSTSVDTLAMRDRLKSQS